MIDLWEAKRETNGFLIVGLLVLVGAAVWVCSRKVYKTFVRPLPGPSGLPFFGNLSYFVANNYDILKTLTTLAHRYGGFFKLVIARTAVVITAPEHLQIFYSSSYMIDRSSHYQHIADVIGDSLFTSAGTKWRRLRKILTVNFTNTPVEILKNNFERRAKVMVAELADHANGEAFPCFRFLLRATLDTVMLNTLGYTLNSRDEKNQVLDAIKYLQAITYMRNISPLMYFTFIFRLTPTGKMFMKQNRFIDELVKSHIQAKRQETIEMKEKGNSPPNLYIYNFLENNGSETVDMLANEFKNILIAGLDTTAGTMAFTLITMGLFPHVQEKVYKEDQMIQNSLGGRELDAKDLQQYVYLERVIKETLRIFPVGPIIGRKAGKDIYFGEYLVPKGTDVLALQIYTNHSAQYYADPLTFDPDRFLPENLSKLPPYTYNPFSAGPRNCPGARYASTSMKIFLTSVIREYKIFSIYNSLEEALHNANAEITMKDKNDFPIRLQPRKK